MLSSSSTDSFVDWLSAAENDDLPRALVARRFDPNQIVAPSRIDPRHGLELFDWLSGLVVPGGSWSIGVHGAAEFDGTDALLTIDRRSRTISASTSTGALRPHIDDDVRAIVIDRFDRPGTPLAIVFASPRSGPLVRDRRDRRGRQRRHRPITPRTLTDRHRARTPLHAVLDSCPRPFADRATRLAGRHQLARIVRRRRHLEAYPRVPASRRRKRRRPHRGLEPDPRAERVFSPGSHTHLRPGELELELDAPPGIAIPDELTVGAIYFPPREAD